MGIYIFLLCLKLSLCADPIMDYGYTMEHSNHAYPLLCAYYPFLPSCKIYSVLIFILSRLIWYVPDSGGHCAHSVFGALSLLPRKTSKQDSDLSTFSILPLKILPIAHARNLAMCARILLPFPILFV